MLTTSSDLEGGPRPSLNLLDLPREIKDQIYGFVVCDRYIISPHLRRRSPTRRGDDFRHLSILRVSKCVNSEVMKVLQMGSWFIYNLFPLGNRCRVFQEAPTRHMMNVELMVSPLCTDKDIGRVILGFAGIHISRRTCHILMPEMDPVLAGDRNTSRYETLRLYFQYIKLLTGFATVVVQVDLTRKKGKRRVEYDDERDRMLRDMIEFSEPALGPAVPCDSVREQYDVNFRFSPLQFVAKRLASAELGVGHEGLKRDQ